MKIKLMLLCILFSTIVMAQSATIKGRVTDYDTAKPIEGAIVKIKNSNKDTTTDENGNFVVSLSAGTYSISINYVGYDKIAFTVDLKQGEELVLEKTLKINVKSLDEVVVKKIGNREKETAILLEQKKAVIIKQSIGAQEMSRKGVSDVEEGLTKITGISKVDSKGLFIRGLEERYNSLLINNLIVPSNSPFKKMIPLDQFPTDVVGYIDVFKTFNPDIYGDFAGATIDVKTSQYLKKQTKISYGIGYTTNNNLNDFLISEDANNTKSYFGFGGQERQLPNGYGAIPNGRINNDYQSSWNVNQIQAPLNTSFGISHSGKFDIGKANNKFYYLFATNFDNKYQIREGVDRTFSQGQGIYDNNLSRKQFKFQTQASALLGLQYKTERAKLFYNGLYLKSTENLIQDQVGYTRTAVQNPNEFIRTNQYEQSDYFTNQFFGNYKLTADDKHSLNGGISYTRTKYSQPDRKFITGTKISDTEINTQYGSNNLIRQFFNIDNNFHVSGNLEYHLKFGKNEDKLNKLSFGYNGFSEFVISKFRFAFGEPNGASPYNTSFNNIDQSIKNDIANNMLSFKEQSTSEWKTKVFQRADAAYTNVLLNINEKLEFNIGIRAEKTIREYKYRPIVNTISSPYLKKTNDNLYILPSLNIKYAATEKNNFRLAISKTYTKPILFESLDINLINADGTIELGNSNLDNSENYNADIKFEMFPSSKELFAATFFAKYIDKPIERTILASATGSGQTISYFNNESAKLFGFEFETLLQLNRLHESLNGFAFGFNTSLMITESTIDKNRPSSDFDTFQKRNLQGASNWLVNSDIKYEFNLGANCKNTTSLVYNVYGERIYAVGVAGNDHIYEKPFHKLDFIWNSSINKKWDIKFSVDNILNPLYKRELGNESKISIDEPSLLLQSYKRGVGISTSISYSF
jgi:outer membrane receptor protein involved in Fe transport